MIIVEDAKGMNAMKATSAISGAVPVPSSQGLPELPPRALWDLLSRDSGAGVLVCDTSGKIHFMNDRFARFINQPSAEATTGKMLTDIYPESAARERIEVMQRTARERRPLVVESVWNGVAFQTILRPLATLGGDPELVIALARYQPRKACDDAPADVERVALRSNNMGPLSRLTVRELELLALIGEGLSTHEIAKRISRSIKTVEAHRASLGKKLGVASRVALAKIAAESNLHFDMLPVRQVVGGRLANRGDATRSN
jgi:DNA-binding CsgD family transcriptional regulator